MSFWGWKDQLIVLSVWSDSGLPPSGSWQDLKDHMREAGDVCYADVYRDGSGVVEYLKYDDMKYALRKLDDTKFKSHEVRAPASILFYLYFIIVCCYWRCGRIQFRCGLNLGSTDLVSRTMLPITIVYY